VISLSPEPSWRANDSAQLSASLDSREPV
jgi:hypothetical protein